MTTRHAPSCGLAAAITLLSGAACPLAAAADVLVLGDGGSEAQVIAALQAAGHTVTDAGPYETWDGSGLAGMDAVVYLDGVNYGNGLMPQADAALAAYVAAGGRLILTEWTAYDVANDFLTGQVAQLMAVTSPGGSYAYGNTWTVTAPGHPLAAGLPAAWSDAAGFSFVEAHPASIVVITGTSGNPLLAYRTDSGGPVIHLNHDMTYTTPQIHPNTLQLLVNAVSAELFNDCDGNGQADAAEIAAGAPDANGNGVPDGCEVSGAIVGSVVWESGHTVYVTADLAIEGTLSIEPGVEVVPSAGVELLVEAGGQLLVGGTAAEPVRMRPAGLDRWDGIRFEGTGVMVHAELERLTSYGISIIGADPVIESCVIRDVEPASGGATGIRVMGDAEPVIVWTSIESVRGADTPASGNGNSPGPAPDGADGGGGEACPTGGYHGEDGGWGPAGGAGPAGQPGGDAVGVEVVAGASASIVGCRVLGLSAGNGGTGGIGGNGGAGGDGGDGTGGFLCGGWGGNGAVGGHGGTGGTGGKGGQAVGVRLDQAGVCFIVENVIAQLQGGLGGEGGTGGNSGAGGDGGDGAFNLFVSGCCGYGGNGGTGGDGGTGGNGGDALSVAIIDPLAATIVAQNTIDSVTRGAPGPAGGPGAGAPGGQGGSTGGINPSCLFSQSCPDGSLGGSGLPGGGGTSGVAVAVNATSTGPGPFITVTNNAITPGNPAYSVALRAQANAVIVSDFNCVFDYQILASGGVSVGPGTLLADPMLLDPDGPDNVPGNADDDLRLAAASPAIDAASNAALPADVADLDGDQDTVEPTPLDASALARVVAGIVDMGAFEFGNAPLPCPADISGDGEVGVVDFLALLQAWGPNPGHPADLDGDGTIAVTDFLALLQAWGPCP